MEKQRSWLWDNVKSILILLVVIGHFTSTYVGISHVYKSMFLFIYSFHMPAFIFISGYFHKNEKIAEKIYCYCALGMLINIVIFLTKWIFYGIIELNFFSNSGLPWFMFALAFYIFFAYMTKNISTKVLLIVSLIIACFTGYDKSIGDTLAVSRILVYLPFFLSGRLFANNKKNKEIMIALKSLPGKIISWIIILGWAAACFFETNQTYKLRPLFTGRNAFPDSMIGFGCFYRLLCMAITFMLIFAIISVVPDKKIPFITKAGKNTLSIYSWHYVLIYIFMKIFDIDKLCSTDCGKILWILIGVAITAILALDVFSYPLNLLVRYKKVV